VNPVFFFWVLGIRYWVLVKIRASENRKKTLITKARKGESICLRQGFGETGEKESLQKLLTISTTWFFVLKI
jgi:hypothetical protein